jgi:hypothetical protein
MPLAHYAHAEEQGQYGNKEKLCQLTAVINIILPSGHIPVKQYKDPVVLKNTES